jgi:PBP1b-binding outer membrane lipoprotein LpoB
MTRMLALSLLAAAALGIAACSNEPAPAPETSGSSVAPQAAPANPNAPDASGGSTLQRQENSGYYPNAGSPYIQVAPANR